MGKVMLVGGGVHQWNMTVEQSRTAIYVSEERGPTLYPVKTVC